MPKEQVSPQKQTPRDVSSQQDIAEQDSKKLRDLLGRIGTSLNKGVESLNESEAGHSEVLSL
jgi:hypothetical protein